MVHQYQIVGRKIPTDAEKNPTLYRMAVFAPNKVVAKSRFWYFLSQLRKMKKATGEVIQCQEVFERKPIVARNYGIWLRYNSRTGTHNMYKEFRDVSVNGAVAQAYQDMAARHSARADVIQIVRVAEVAAKDTRRQYVQMFHDNSIKFPLPNRRVLKPKRFRSTFLAQRPSTLTA
ncbi:60S large subunit ribosomal protein eL20 (rpL18A) [Andalucia godoyi]|uniref:60S ribosomal protein L18a n=1 Tax=Andalucia godoyi TaxID=505711 RepID=A0A8K0F2W8_ANDGO|nr:60S large subunit ribosomal protein eL20 (rpL18A) [Andalucia godoyi]|eukprot:ANDGO_04468.mRNA.1 60S large subunit ribosomal protein eL20 (rpL18A)